MSVDLGSLTLRPVRETDARRIHEWASAAEACRYQSWGPNTTTETEAFVSAGVAAWHERPQRRWMWVAVDSADTVFGLGEVKQHSTSRVEITYSVHVRHWGEGIGSALARLLVDWTFGELASVERVEATCDPRNVASEKVLRNVGMTYEGTLRHTTRIRDGWRDSKMFSMLRQEWQPLDEQFLRAHKSR